MFDKIQWMIKRKLADRAIEKINRQQDVRDYEAKLDYRLAELKSADKRRKAWADIYRR